MSRPILVPLFFAIATGATAQTYPDRPLRIVSPFSAGGPADIYARYLAQRLEKPLGQAVVVENRVGAGGIIGADAVAKAPADGYTLLVMSNTHTINETLVPKKPYRLTVDLAPIAPINYSDLLLVVHPSVPAKSVAELVQHAKTNPGKLNYASSGTGTPYHLAGELFKSLTGTQILHVPHKESSGARTSVMGGQVEMMFDAITVMARLADAGKVRAIATSSRARSAATPDLPTLAEAGVPGFDAVIWLGIMAPAATPRPIVERLNAEIQRIIAQPDTNADFAKQGAVPMQMSAEAFGRFIRDDIDKWAKVIQASGMKVD